MSICGYLGPNKPKRAKKAILRGATGPVLSGQSNPADVRRQESLETAISQEVFGVELFGVSRPRRKWQTESHASVDEYDPVLMSHCFQLVPVKKRGDDPVDGLPGKEV